jgi:hypothetical protein
MYRDTSHCPVYNKHLGQTYISSSSGRVPASTSSVYFATDYQVLREYRSCLSPICVLTFSDLFYLTHVS